MLACIVTRDVRTPTGHNIYHIGKEIDLDPWSCSTLQVREAMAKKVRKVEKLDMWRLPYLEKLLAKRGEDHYDAKDTTEFTTHIDSLCVN